MFRIGHNVNEPVEIVIPYTLLSLVIQVLEIGQKNVTYYAVEVIEHFVKVLPILLLLDFDLTHHFCVQN